MSNFFRKADELVFIAAAIGPWAFIVAIVIIVGLVKGCLPDKADPMDNDINKSREILEHVMVMDSTYNGFRVVYVTGNAVTEKRFREIRSRQHIREGFERLKREAPEHFGGSLRDVDICEFALYARNFHIDDDIRIHNIFIAGHRMDDYVQPNPNLPECVTSMNYGTEQGNQYLDDQDINVYIPNGGRRYRYWKCRYLLQVSDTDERFSHFTEEERLY